MKRVMSLEIKFKGICMFLNATINFVLISLFFVGSTLGQDLGQELSIDFDVDLSLYKERCLAERGGVGVFNNKYYLGTYSGKFIAVDTGGNQLWSFMTDASIHSNVVFDSNGTVYFTSRDMFLYAIDSDSNLKWKAVIDNQGWSVAIGKNDTIYATGGSYLHAFDTSGKEIWANNVGPWVSISTVLEDGTIIVGSQDHCIRAYSSSGVLKWVSQVSCGGSELLKNDGLLIVVPGYPDRWVYAIDINDGSIKWKQPFSTYGGGVAVNGNNIYLLNGRNIYSLSSSDGSIIWNSTFDPDKTFELYATANSWLYFGEDGYLYFDVQTDTNIVGGINSILYAFDTNGNLIGADLNFQSEAAYANCLEVKNAAPGGGVFISVDGHLQIRSVKLSNLTTYFRDSDNDNYGDPGSPYKSASKPAGYVTNNTDCNDYDSSIHPGATEIRGDGIDQDCNGSDLPQIYRLTQTQVSQLYVSIFGRASEGEGNTYWQTNQDDMVVAADTMLATGAAQAYFGATLDDDQAFIEFIYENTLGKTYEEDPDGVDYWVGELASGKSKGQVTSTLINAVMDPKYAGMASQNRFINKVAVCNYTAETVDTCPNINDLSAFVGVLSGVTDNSVTVTTAKEVVDTLL